MTKRSPPRTETTAKRRGARYVVATDVGGTCTDTIVFAVGEPVHIGKSLSTPPNFADGVFDSIKSAADAMGVSVGQLLADTALFVHGSTVVDNTLLTRDGAKTGLLLTEGFEDTLHVTRGAYGRWGGLTEDRIKHPVKTDRPAPLVDLDCVRGIPERVDYKGAVLRPLDEEAVARAIAALVERGCRALAVSFLWSFHNAEHEERVAAIAKRVAPDLYVSVSSAIAPVPGEYERTSTAVINAYAGRIARDYVNRLTELLAERGYNGTTLIMQGYGGLLPAAEAADRSVGMIECGPAAGVIGSRYLGDLMGDRDVIAADMGGTTFKVGVIQAGELEYAREPMVDRFHYIAPKIDVVSIGAGGGSIVALDPRTKVPRVGPRSAGARPGPICYGQGGTEPTLTDVLALIGYMDPEIFLGGTMRLDIEAARKAFAARIARPMGMKPDEAAFGIYRIAAAQITDLIREITVERGLDPRDFTLHAFGGTCGLLCGLFGEELAVKRVVVPYTAAVNCAFGLVAADVVHEYSVTTTLPVPSPAQAIEAIYAPLFARAHAQFKAEDIGRERIRFDRAIDLRYRRQVHEVTTPLRADVKLTDRAVARLVEDFEALYQRKFGKGSAYREAGMEMTMFRLSARALMTRPQLEKRRSAGASPKAAHMGKRRVFVAAKDGFSPADIYDFERLESGNVVKGPAVIHTPITTIVVQAGQIGRIDGYRNTIIEFN